VIEKCRWGEEKKKSLGEKPFPQVSDIPYFIIGGTKGIKTISCGRNGKKKSEANCMVPFQKGNPGLLSHQSKWAPFSSAPIDVKIILFLWP
jgi:hypothetical protein